MSIILAICKYLAFGVLSTFIFYAFGLLLHKIMNKMSVKQIYIFIFMIMSIGIGVLFYAAEYDTNNTKIEVRYNGNTNIDPTAETQT